MIAAALGLPVLLIIPTIGVWIATIVKTISYNKLAQDDPERKNQEGTIKGLKRASSSLAGAWCCTIVVVLFFATAR